MTGVSIKDQIKKLVELQKFDAEIYELRRELKEKPAFLEELKGKFESQKFGLKELEEKLKAIQLIRKQKELDLQTKEAEIVKANSQLSQIKTNKEYTAKMSEIEHIKADMSLIEEKVLISYDEADALMARVEKEKGFVAEEEKKYLAKKNEIDSSIKVIEEKLRGLESKRKAILPETDKPTFERYERILKNKDGLAIVPVQGNSCGGCYMNVPQQVINEMKMGDKIIYCEICARMLYLQEEL